MKRTNHISLVVLASLCGLGCSIRYDDWKVAASYEISATRLEPATGALLSTTALGTVAPPTGASYLWWSGSTYSSSEAGGIAVLGIGTCVRDSETQGEYYNEGSSIAMAVLSRAEADDLVAYSGDPGASIAGGATPLLIAGGKSWALGAGPALVDSGTSYESASASPYATWNAGGASGLVSTFPLGSTHSLGFNQSGGSTYLDGYDTFACAYLAYEGGSNFLAPFFTFALDAATGKTLKTLTLVRADAMSGTASVLWSFSTDLSPAAFACVDVAPAGVYRLDGGSLVLMGPAGDELGRAVLSAADASGRPLAGPLAGSGIVFAAMPMGDERLGTGGGPVTGGVSWYDATPKLSWSVSLPDPSSRVVAVFKYPGYLVVIGAKPLGAATVTHAENLGF